MTTPAVPISVEKARCRLSRWDLIAGLLTLGLLIFLAEASRGLMQPLADLTSSPVSLDPANLPAYAGRTTLRMLAAMVASLLFTFTYATWAAKSRRAELVLLPLLDILQSVPILGFLSVTVVFFMALAPGRVLGAECAAVFAIFTSQAWNMAFSFYQSLRTVPVELIEASRCFQRQALDALLAGGSAVRHAGARLEHDDVDVRRLVLRRGLGGDQRRGHDGHAAGDRLLHRAGHRRSATSTPSAWAIGAMLVVILIYDQLLFRPLVAWADRFRFEQEAGVVAPRSWVLDDAPPIRSGRVGCALPRPAVWRRSYRRRPALASSTPLEVRGATGRWPDWIWTAVGLILAALALWLVIAIRPRRRCRSPRSARAGTRHCHAAPGARADRRGQRDLGADRRLGGTAPGWRASSSRWRSSWPPFPANLSFPWRSRPSSPSRLNPDIWLSPLMILGTQWYILFNVIAGASALPSELRDVGDEPPRPWLAVVATDRAAGRLAVLRHGRDHRLRRLVERQHRRRGGDLGRSAARGPRAGRLHCAGDRGRRLSSHRAGDRGHEPVRRGPQPRVLAPALLAMRSASSAWTDGGVLVSAAHRPTSPIGTAADRHFRRLVAALGLTTGFLVVEIGGSFWTGSLALLADAGHMLTDAGGLTLSLLAAWFARKPPTPAHTYGYYRTEILAALANGAVLFAMAGFILYEAYRRLWSPPEIVAGPMLLIAIVGLGVNLAGMWLLRDAGGESLNVRGAYLEMVGDALGRSA